MKGSSPPHRKKGITEFKDICLYPGVKLPDKFKIPDFEKYDGKGCPQIHLKVDCGDMFQLGTDDQFFMKFFQKSLTGSALKWFTSLDHSQLKSWKDLSEPLSLRLRWNWDRRRPI
jgi:hypothetical protein